MNKTITSITYNFCWNTYFRISSSTKSGKGCLFNNRTYPKVALTNNPRFIVWNPIQGSCNLFVFFVQFDLLWFVKTKKKLANILEVKVVVSIWDFWCRYICFLINISKYRYIRYICIKVRFSCHLGVRNTNYGLLDEVYKISIVFIKNF
jgi:hypothetical protein